MHTKFKLDNNKIKPELLVKVGARELRCLIDTGADMAVWDNSADDLTEVFPTASPTGMQFLHDGC